jgi:ribosome maturation factor RimP
MNQIITKVLVLSLIIFASLFLSKNYIHAQDNKNSSPSPEVNKEEITQKLKERLDKAVTGEGIQSTQSAQPVNQWYSYFGYITEVAKSTLIIETKEKKRIEIKFDENTKLSLFQKGKTTKTVKAEDIQSGWFAIAMGTDYQAETSLVAQRISFSTDDSDQPEKKVVVGKIKEVDDTTMTVTNGQTVTVTIPKDLTLKIKGVDKPKVEDLSINDKVVAIVETVKKINKNKQEESTTTLKALFAIPSLNNPKSADNLLENEGTQSAEATSSSNKNQ